MPHVNHQLSYSDQAIEHLAAQDARLHATAPWARSTDPGRDEPQPGDAEGGSRLELVGPLDDRRHVRPLPVGLDPAHVLIGPVDGCPAPVPADHEPAENGAAVGDPFQLLHPAHPRDLDRSRKEVDLLRAVREGWSGAMTGPRRIRAWSGSDLPVDARARGIEDGVDGDAEQSAKRVRVGE